MDTRKPEGFLWPRHRDRVVKINLIGAWWQRHHLHKVLQSEDISENQLTQPSTQISGWRLEVCSHTVKNTKLGLETSFELEEDPKL